MSHKHKTADTAPSQGQAPQPEKAAPAAAPAAEPAAGQEDLSLVGHDTLEALQRELEETKAKADEHWKLFLGARAEMENMRKRTERELANAHKYALEKFVKDLLPVKDNLERGISHAGEAADLNKLIEGSELTLKDFADALAKVGVEEVDPQGQKFDPARHQAMSMQPSAEAEPNTVLHVVQKGYVLNDRLIRPALVIVAQAVKKPDQGIENAQPAPK